MSSTDPDVKDNVDAETNAQIKTPSPAANQSKSSSPAYSTLLVIDDSSNSEEPPAPSSTDIPAKPTLPLPPQISDIPPPVLIPPSSSDVADFSNDTPEQHRRRNSSIAKLLGGQPLNNQYEEINQQIIGHQSALIASSNGENGFDAGNQRSRSFITRTLLMNPERTNSFNKVPTKPQAMSSTSSSSSSSSAPAPRDFEYLIRQVDKPDNDHPASMLQRHNSAPKLIQNLTSLSNAHAQLSSQSKLKRKRSMLSSSMSAANMSPFSLHEPFELQSSATNSLSAAHASHSSNDLLHLESAKRARHSSPQRYNPPVNPSSASPPPYAYTKLNMNAALYNQFSVHRDALPSSNCVLSYPCPRFPQSSKLTLPSPVTHLSPPASRTSNAPLSTSPRKAKSIFARSDGHDAPRQRSFSSTFNPSDSPLASSAEPSVPLKKRLLHAYNNEQRPTTPL